MDVDDEYPRIAFPDGTSEATKTLTREIVAGTFTQHSVTAMLHQGADPKVIVDVAFEHETLDNRSLAVEAAVGYGMWGVLTALLMGEPVLKNRQLLHCLHRSEALTDKAKLGLAKALLAREPSLTAEEDKDGKTPLDKFTASPLRDAASQRELLRLLDRNGMRPEREEDMNMNDGRGLGFGRKHKESRPLRGRDDAADDNDDMNDGRGLGMGRSCKTPSPPPPQVCGPASTESTCRDCR
ncbi:unnamed protein product [Vitrella brassicaformis CCMP3155]|uniref:Uncharacterized protein n=1 Tax=Vitrella brassicaformis (strain CCMP3155) TaxID=1169540 RepID=A0A0G4FQF2_VITBC|nr:unnamed protein product [Vitrella brassicaformis CCMP3155]|eukprot:CEM16507.1 unnamed protein product [Vitrella brassicaformis CCMP3155]